MTESSIEMAVLLFETVHDSLRTEDILERTGLAYRAIVKPRELGSDCGVAIRIQFADIPFFLDLIRDRAIRLKGIYHQVNGEWHVVDQLSAGPQTPVNTSPE